MCAWASYAAPNQLRIVAKFKDIRDSALAEDWAEMWEAASTIRKLAREIQEMLGASPDDADPEGQDWQDLGRGVGCTCALWE